MDWENLVDIELITYVEPFKHQNHTTHTHTHAASNLQINMFRWICVCVCSHTSDMRFSFVAAALTALYN